MALTGVDSVQVCGKNMLPNKAKTNTVAGITYTVNPDKSVTAKGTATSWSNIVIDADFSLPAGTYTLNSNIQTAGVSLVIGKDTSGKKNIAVSSTASKTFTLSDSIKHCVAYIAVAPDSVVDTTIRPMLNLGSTAMPYEPYQGSVTHLPIPRPLHKVGDVRDVCQTRVKSVYDKHIVLSSADGFSFSGNAGNGYARFYKAYNSAKLSPIASDWLPGYAKTAYNATNEGVYSADSDAGTISIVLSIQRLIAAGATSGDTSTYLSAASAIFSAHPLTVYYQSTAYDGTNGLDICLTEYQTGFVEIDGETVRGSYAQNGERPYGIVVSPSTIVSQESLICSNANVENQNLNWGYVYASNNPIKDFIFGLIGSDIMSTTELNAYFAAQKAAGTPVQVVYQLATPEQYATDPIDFNNDAGPLTVVTGGQVEVKMTDFVTDRTPAFLNKLDKTGDGSDVTVTFTEASTDTDIASGDKLSILFGKILKRFTNILNGTTKVGYATKADTDNLGNQITETYANSLDVADNTIVLKNKIGENLSTITVPYANSAGNVATSIKEMGIAVQTASPYAWFLNYTGSGNKDGARKYYASVYADNATYSTSAGSSNNIVIYNNNWSGTDGSISAVYANAEKTYVNLASSNAAGTAWPNISVQRINGHALNMALNGTSLSITW